MCNFFTLWVLYSFKYSIFCYKIIQKIIKKNKKIVKLYVMRIYNRKIPTIILVLFSRYARKRLVNDNGNGNYCANISNLK